MMENKLQTARWEKNWTQAQLARISGVSQSVICEIENNRKDPRLSTALKLAHALSQSVESLFSLP